MPSDGNCQLGKLWTERGEYWLAQSTLTLPKRPMRRRQTRPLILSGHGVHLRVDKATLHIRNGFTHYPQDQETFRFFRGDLDLPTRIIMLDGSGGISFDVLAWLSEQGVTLIQLDWHGDVVTVIGGAGYSGDAAKVRWQIETQNDERERLAFATALIHRKISASISTIKTALPPSPSCARAVEKFEGDLADLKDRPPADIAALRGIEGRASAAYFATWRGLPLAWKAVGRAPIPDLWRTIGSRSAVRFGKIAKNERATHPLNAMLNYGYAVLQTRLQIEAVAAGYDPTIGIMHQGYRAAHAYIFDIMEPERPNVDAAVLKFALAETFTGADFVIGDDGTCRLSPQLARRVASMVAK